MPTASVTPRQYSASAMMRSWNCRRVAVFLHGLFADGSGWSKVIARLQQKGVNGTSVQYPLTELAAA